MDAHELGGGQVVLHLFHREQGDDGLLTLKVNLQVFAHALDVADVADGDAHHAVVGLDEDGAVGLHGAALLLGRVRVAQVVLLLYLHRGTQEVVHAERLQQVVDGVDLVALDGIFRVGGGEDDERRGCQLAHEVHAAEVGHIDVAEDGVHHVVLHDLACLECAAALACQFEKRHFADVGDELAQGQGLVVDG